MASETIDNIRVENDREHETVADIAAVLRRYVLPSLADRLEAAAKRERAKIEADALAVGGIVESARQKPVGNAAAMREALEGMCKASQDVFRSFARETFAGERRLDSLGRAFDKAQAALSAPARNCDLYATATEALKAQDVAFNEDNFKNGECRLGCPGCDDGLIDCKILWLFAPAAEREGDGDGDK